MPSTPVSEISERAREVFRLLVENYLEAGAPVVFVPGRLSEEHVAALVDALGPQRLTLIAIPGNPPLARLEELGVARVSFGPLSQNVALTALQELVEDVHRGGGVPASMRVLN